MPTPRPSQSAGKLPGAPGAFTPDPTPRLHSHTPRDPAAANDPSNAFSTSPRAGELEDDEKPFSSRKLSSSSRQVPGGGKSSLAPPTYEGSSYKYKPMTPHGQEDRNRSEPAAKASNGGSRQGQELGPLPMLQEDFQVEDDPGCSFLPPTVEDDDAPAPPPPTMEPHASARKGRPQSPRAEDVGRPPSPPARPPSPPAEAVGRPQCEPLSRPPYEDFRGNASGAQAEDLRGNASGAQAEADDFSEGGDNEFATPEEATPLGHLAKKAIAPAPMAPCPEDDLLTSCPPPSSTGGAPSIYELKSHYDPSALWKDEQFKDWMKTLNMGQKMRVQERLVIRAAVERSEHAIQALSTVVDKSDSAWLPTWEAAAQWSLGWFQETEFAPYLRHLGYEAQNDQKWTALPRDSGISLHVELLSHAQMAGHTWYQVNCQLKRSAARGDMAWPAPRRLVQMRLDLHDRLKYILGADYARHFADTRFAKYGAPPGTTARLRAWLDKLTSLINSGEVPPGVAAVTLAFFQAPIPEGVDQPRTMGALREAGESDSNLGGPSATPSIQGDSNYGGGASLRGDFL